jgi:hypothetical protein
MPVFVGMIVLGLDPLPANELTNGDVKTDMQGWSGDGERVLLKPDGTEGAEGDAGAIPVIKLALSHGQSRNVFQDLHLADNSKGLLFRVDVYPSADFERSKYESDYNDHERMISSSIDIMVPMTDFWIRLGPILTANYSEWQYRYHSTDLKPGQWTTVTSRTESTDKLHDHFTADFCVPAGNGALYLKNCSVEAKPK